MLGITRWFSFSRMPGAESARSVIEFNAFWLFKDKRWKLEVSVITETILHL